MDQFQGNPYGYPNPYEPAFSQRIKQYANGVANFPRPAVLAMEAMVLSAT